MKKIPLLTILISALLLIGAGCQNQADKANQAGQDNSDNAILIPDREMDPRFEPYIAGEKEWTNDIVLNYIKWAQPIYDPEFIEWVGWYQAPALKMGYLDAPPKPFYDIDPSHVEYDDLTNAAAQKFGENDWIDLDDTENKPEGLLNSVVSPLVALLSDHNPAVELSDSYYTVTDLNISRMMREQELNISLMNQYGMSLYEDYELPSDGLLQEIEAQGLQFVKLDGLSYANNYPSILNNEDITDRYIIDVKECPSLSPFIADVERLSVAEYYYDYMEKVWLSDLPNEMKFFIQDAIDMNLISAQTFGIVMDGGRYPCFATIRALTGILGEGYLHYRFDEMEEAYNQYFIK